MSRAQYFSHITAALLWDVPLPWRLEHAMVLDVSVDAPAHPPQVSGVRGHVASGPRGKRVVRGLPVLAPADVWCELAGLVDHDGLVIAGDHLVRRKHPASTLAELHTAVARLGARRHVRALRAALGDIRAGTESPMETRLRLLIVRSGLAEPVVCFAVHDEGGAFIGTPDLAYVQQKIAVEYEGAHHQTDPTTYAQDIERRERFERAGWLVILVLKEHIRERPAWLLSRIRTALLERS